jgi:hypothetical protein
LKTTWIKQWAFWSVVIGATMHTYFYKRHATRGNDSLEFWIGISSATSPPSPW